MLYYHILVIIYIIINMKWNDGLEEGTPAHTLASSKSHTIRSVAGPGAGKSFAIQRRITRLLSEGINPEKILAVTFTRTAANDLRKDISELAVVDSEKVAARTLHSHALGILMRSDVIEKTQRTPRMILEHELKPGLYDLTNDYGTLPEKKKMSDSYLAAWATLQADGTGAEEKSQIAFEGDIVNWMKEHGGMLVGEVIPEAIKYLENNPACDAIGAYDVILVDEYQDLNKAEQELIRLIRQDASIVIVGDDDQSIYSFKFAHPAGIQTIDSLHGEFEDIPFEVCRRCPTKVVSIASSLISNNPNRTLGELIPFTENPEGEIDIIQWRNFEEEIPGLVEIIKKELAKGTIEPKDILILSPRRLIGYKFRDRLLAEGIPVKSYFRESAIKKLVVQRAYSLMSLFAYPEDMISLRFLLGGGQGDAKTAQYKRLSDEALERKISIRELLDLMVKGEVELTHTTTILREYKRVVEELLQIKEVLLTSPEELIQSVFVGDSEEKELEFYELNQIYTDSLSEEGVDDATSEELLNDWFKKVFSRIQQQVTNPEIPENIDHARIMSLHSSKGLSSKFVIVCSMIDELMPFIDKDATEEEVKILEQEQRRLFYVAITRCKGKPEDYPGKLIISSFINIPGIEALRLGVLAKVGINRKVSSTRFIGELGSTAPKSVLGETLIKV